METKIIAVCNQKGGVGKTTTTVNLGVGLAKEGYSVLLVDCDPQGSLTTSLGFDPDSLGLTISDGLDRTIQDYDMQENEINSMILRHPEGIDIIPANISLAVTELSLVTAMSRESTLRRFLNDTIKIRDKYDYVLIDCLPSLGMIMQNALGAADSLIIPVTPNYLSLSGMLQLFDTISRIKRHINPELEIEGIVLTIVNSRTNLSKQTITALTDTFGDNIKIFKSYIPQAVKTAEAPIQGKSIYSYEPAGKVAAAYAGLAKEVIDNE